MAPLRRPVMGSRGPAKPPDNRTLGDLRTTGGPTRFLHGSLPRCGRYRPTASGAVGPECESCTAESGHTGSRRLRCARPRPRRAAALGGPTRHGAARASRTRSDDRAGSSAALTDASVCRLPRHTSVPVAATASRAPTASQAIATRPLTCRPLTRDSAPTRMTGENQAADGPRAGLQGQVCLSSRLRLFRPPHRSQAPR
jgi:hypothetical protein